MGAAGHQRTGSDAGSPAVEQDQIASELGRWLSIVDEIEAQIDADLHRAARLRQGILKRAFEGRPVPQDPDYEPDDRALERIRQARNGDATDPPAPALRPKGRTAGRRKKASSEPTWFD